MVIALNRGLNLKKMTIIFLRSRKIEAVLNRTFVTAFNCKKSVDFFL